MRKKIYTSVFFFLSRNLSVIHWSKKNCRTLPLSSSLTEKTLRKWILLSCPDSWLKPDLLHPFLWAFIKGTYWGWEGWFHISQNSYQDRVGGSKNAMFFLEREYIWMDLLFLLGQKKHTKHNNFSHFNLQTQHMYGKTPDSETQTQKERTHGSYISLYIADRKTRRFVCTANKSKKPTAMQYRNSPPRYHDKWQASMLWIWNY